VTMKMTVDAQLSVADHDMPALQASLAPNPAKNVVTVFFNNPKESKVRFEILSLQGQVVMSETEYFGEGEQQVELHLGNLANGFYLLRMNLNDGVVETLKLLKQ